VSEKVTVPIYINNETDRRIACERIEPLYTCTRIDLNDKHNIITHEERREIEPGRLLT